MTHAEKLTEILKKKGIKPKPAKVKGNPSDLTSAAKQKELLVKIATDLGYM